MYSKLTQEQRDMVEREFRGALSFATDVNHAVSCAAVKLVKSDRAWNGKAGADAFAAALATLVMRGIIQLIS